MRTFVLLLRDGLRLSVLRTPRAVPLDAGAWHWLALALLLLGVDAAWHRSLVAPPQVVNAFGLQTAATGEVLRLLGAALICTLAARRALFWTVFGWMTAAALLPTALLGSLLATLGPENPLWFQRLWWAGLIWLLLVLLRLALWLAPRPRWRATAAAGLATALAFGTWYVLPSQLLWTTDWAAGYAADADDELAQDAGSLAEPERAMYAQSERVDAALAALAPQRSDRADLYLVAFGGDASENVFRNEVEYIERLFAQRFDAAGRTVALLNHPDSVDRRPLATATNLERVLRGIGERIDPRQDIVFLYLTSHGSDAHELLVNQPPLALDQLTPQRLREALDASGIGWRVLVVSACYSGGYIEALRDPQTLVITAARHDRSSFGCGSESDITWFGRAFLAEALNAHTDFVAAFEQARARVAEWEKDQALDPSEPQIDQGERIASKLAGWRSGITPGPALAFVPPSDATDADDGDAPAESVQPAAAAPAALPEPAADGE